MVFALAGIWPPLSMGTRHWACSSQLESSRCTRKRKEPRLSRGSRETSDRASDQLLLRRLAAAAPNKAMPTSAMDIGSGTGVTVLVLEVLTERLAPRE